MRRPRRAVGDDHVDRPQVEAQRCVEPSGTNCPNACAWPGKAARPSAAEACGTCGNPALTWPEGGRAFQRAERRAAPDDVRSRVPCGPTLMPDPRSLRAISSARLNVSPRLHLRPIDVLVSHDPYRRPNLEAGFALRCLQRLSRPNAATRRCGWRHNRCTGGSSAPVLSY